MSSYIVSLLIAERDSLNAAIQALQGDSPSGPVKRRGRPRARKVDAFDYDAPNVPDWVKPKASAKKKRKMSAAGRRAIREGVRKRWGAVKAAKDGTATPKASKKKSAVLAAVTPSAEDAEFKSKMSIAMKKAWAKRRKTARKA
jgi:hypothetical protein